MRREWGIAVAVLMLALHLCFFKAIWGNRTLLQSARSVPTIVVEGAWAGSPSAPKRGQMLDMGASAWQSEPWFALIGRQFWKEKTLPLWNPYQGFGRPFAANMESQPFYPLTTLLSLHVTPRTFTWYLMLRLLVAGICGFGFLRMLVSFVPALAGAVACMFAGYLILYLNLTHISVEVLSPAALWAAECLIRKPGYKSMAWFAAVILLVFLGGMPESAFLLFLFVYSYIVVRIFSQPAALGIRKRQIGYLSAATVAGLCLSAFFLLPFFEFLHHSFNIHQSGMQDGLLHDKLNASFLGYLVPLAFGPPQTLRDLRNYFGVIGFFLMCVAAAGSWRRKRAGSTATDPLIAITWFAWAVILFVWLKRYGVPGVNQLGMLPVFRLVLFAKYLEPIQSFAVAILIAIGLERLLRRQVTARAQIIAWIATCTLLVSIWFAAPTAVPASVFRAAPGVKIFAFGLAAGLLLLLALCLWRRKFALAAALVGIEFTCCYVVPAYHIFGSLPRRNQNPYLGAPYIDYLKQHAGSDRIFAENGLLTPNWASAFNLFDIRDLNGLYIDRYFPFLNAFFPNAANMDLGPDLKGSFRAWPIYRFSTPLEKRLLQLSSIRYLTSIAVLPNKSPIVEEIAAQNAARAAKGLEKAAGLLAENKVDGEYMETLLEYPPFERLPYELKVDDGPAIFHYAYGLLPGAWDKGGDGAGFTLEIRTPDGEIRPVFQNYLDVQHDPQDRKWVHGTVDLSQFRGKTITLLFSTTPAPTGNTASDWAGWAHLGFADEEPDNQFQLAYEDRMIIFQYDHVLPRAGIFYRADMVDGSDRVLHRLAAPDWDPFQSLVLDTAELDSETRQQISRLNRRPAAPVEAAHSVSFAARKVSIEANLSRPGILMLNDSGFPGWEVTVDGSPAKWFPRTTCFVESCCLPDSTESSSRISR